MAQLNDNVYTRKGAESSFIDWPEKSQNLILIFSLQSRFFFIIRLGLVYHLTFKCDRVLCLSNTVRMLYLAIESESQSSTEVDKIYMGLRPRYGNLRLVLRLFSLMRDLPSISLE